MILMSDVKFSKEVLIRIGEYVLEGLNEDEACVLVGMNSSEFRSICENEESVRTFIEKKRIEFKLKHLQAIGKKESDKNSQWLLEKLRSEEFGTKRSTGDVAVDIIGAILRDIQNNEHDGGIVREEARIVGGGGVEKDSIELSVERVLE